MMSSRRPAAQGRATTDPAWLAAHRRVNLIMAIGMVVVALRRGLVGPGPLAPDPVFWAAVLLGLICLHEWHLLRTGRPRGATNTLLLGIGMGAVLVVVQARGAQDIVWLLAGLPVVFLRLSWRRATVLSLLWLGAALMVAVSGAPSAGAAGTGGALRSGAEAAVWGPLDATTLVRLTLPGLIVIAVLAVMFATFDRVLGALTEARALLESSTRSMAQGFAVFDAEGRLTHHNSRFAEWLELPEALLARHPLRADIVRFQTERGDFGESFQLVEDHARPFVQNQGALPDQGSRPHTYRRRTRAGRHLEITTMPMPSGHVVRTFTDITEHVQLNERLDASLRRIEELRQQERLRTREQVVQALSELSSYRDNETGQHILRTQLYVRQLAQALARRAGPGGEPTPERIELMVKAAPMHDLGKIAIPDQILLKAGRHEPAEREIMRTHAAIGEQTLRTAARSEGDGEEASLLQVAARIAGGHHEHWDGGGYPRALRGADIPLEARIMSLADVYDALTTPRVYKRAWTHEQARDAIVSQRGTKFDPDVVDAFVEEAEAFRQIALRHRDADG